MYPVNPTRTLSKYASLISSFFDANLLATRAVAEPKVPCSINVTASRHTSSYNVLKLKSSALKVAGVVVTMGSFQLLLSKGFVWIAPFMVSN